MTIEGITQDILRIIAEAHLQWFDESRFDDWPERKAEVEVAITHLLTVKLRPLFDRAGR